MAGKSRKATFNLHDDVLAALSEVVARGAAPSKNAVVDRALRRELKELQRQLAAAAWREAAQDPLFMRDLGEIDEAFMDADAETARGTV
ncbi:MAG: hypothetical protein QME77_03760 [bacterium]|nr:hypothetical protein [bacterium]